MQVVQNFLRTADGKRGHDDVAPLQGVPDYPDHLLAGRCKILVVTVAIGRLDDHISASSMGVGSRRIGRPGWPRSPLKTSFGRLSPFRDPYLDDGRTEDVARRGSGSAPRCEASVHGHRQPDAVLAQAIVRILQMQRAQCRILAGTPPRIVPESLRVALLNVSTVRQHHL